MMARKSNDAFFTVARITRAGNVVVNIEVADQDWLNANEKDPWFYFVVYGDNLKDNQPSGVPSIGFRYDPTTRVFEQGTEQPRISESDEIAEVEEIVKGAKRANRK